MVTNVPENAPKINLERFSDFCGCYGFNINGKDFTEFYCPQHEYGKCWSCGKRTAVSVNTLHENGLFCTHCRVLEQTVGDPNAMNSWIRASQDDRVKQSKKEAKIARVRHKG